MIKGNKKMLLNPQTSKDRNLNKAGNTGNAQELTQHLQNKKPRHRFSC